MSQSDLSSRPLKHLSDQALNVQLLSCSKMAKIILMGVKDLNRIIAKCRAEEEEEAVEYGMTLLLRAQSLLDLTVADKVEIEKEMRRRDS